MLILLAACGTGAPPPPAGSDSPRDTLVIALQTDPKDMIPLVAQAAEDTNLFSNLFLDQVDGDFDCEVRAVGSLAKSWSFSEDGTVISMELRDDITWSDGVKVTSKDLAFTFDLIADPVVASPRFAYVEYMKPDGRPAVIDATHVEWRFTHAFSPATMLAQTSIPVSPAHLLQNADRGSLRGHALDTQIPVVNGPWKMTVREKSVKTVLEPNEAFTGPAEWRPRLRRVVFKTLPEYTSRLVELQNGTVDLVHNILVEDADRLATDHPEVRLHRRGWRSNDYVAWNSLDPTDYKAVAETTPAGRTVDFDAVKPHPLFGDREVRRALAAAIDVDKIIKDLLTSKVTGEVYARPAIGTITPALCGAHNDTIRRIRTDAAVASARLAELGWTDTNGDGVIDKEGRPFRFTMLTNSGNARRAKAAIIVQANLRAVGIDMQIDQLESATFFDRLRKKDFDAALSGWSAALFVDPSSTWALDSQFNFTSYRNPEVTALLARGLAEPDDAKANATWHRLQQVIYDDQPYAFLYWMDEIVGVHSRFENTTVDLLAPYRNLHAWSVPPDKVKYPN